MQMGFRKKNSPKNFPSFQKSVGVKLNKTLLKNSDKNSRFHQKWGNSPKPGRIGAKESF